MEQILSENIALIDDTWILHYPSMIFTDDNININIFDSLDELKKFKWLTDDTINNTIQTPTFDNDLVSKVEHIDNDSLLAIRTDLFTYNSDTIIELRELSTGETITLTHNLITLTTEIS